MRYLILVLILLLQSQAVAQNFSMFAPDPVKPAVIDNRPEIRVYCIPNCEPCKKLKTRFSEMPAVKFVEYEAPSWVEGFPTLHWKGTDGNWYQVVGNRFEEFKKRYKETTKPAPKANSVSLQGRSWSIDGSFSPSRSTLIEHLLNDGIHRGKFTRQELESRSTESLTILHSNDHNSHEKTTGNVTTTRSYTPRRRRRFLFGCLNGRCPQ